MNRFRLPSTCNSKDTPWFTPSGLSLSFLFLFLMTCFGVGASHAQTPEIPGAVDNSLVKATLNFQNSAGGVTPVEFRGVISVSRESSTVQSIESTRYELIGAVLEGPQNSQLILKAVPGELWTGNELSVKAQLITNGVTYEAVGVGLCRLGTQLASTLTSALMVNWDLKLPELGIEFLPPIVGDPPIIITPDPDPNVPDVQILQLPSFSVDPNTSLNPPSPSMTFGTGMPPVPGLDVLGDLFEDNVDGFCHGVRVTDPGRNVIFSVDRTSFGNPGSAVNAAATASPAHASSSEFASLGIPVSGAFTPVNTLVVPFTSLTIPPNEDLDALDDSPPAFSDPNGNGTPVRPVWWSLQNGGASTGSSLPEVRPGLPTDGICSGDDILVWVPGLSGRYIYASGRIDIGLQDGTLEPNATDDIDALVIMPAKGFDEGSLTELRPAPKGVPPLNPDGTVNMPNGNLQWDLGFFSLSRNSASLGGPNLYTASDIFVTNFNGTFMRLHNAAALDLSADDNLNAMKFMLSSWHGSVDVVTDPTGTSTVTFDIGDTSTVVVIPPITAGSDALVANTIVNALNTSEYFQARPYTRAFANPFNSSLITLVGLGPCNTRAISADPGIVITNLIDPLPFPLAPILICPNDECPDALGIAPGGTIFDTSCATPSPDPFDPTMCFGLGGVKDDLWYTFSPPECGTVKVSTCPFNGSATFDTDLVAYRGTCSDKVQIACSGDVAGCSGGTSEMEFTVSANNVYYIRVGGVDDTVNGPGELFLDFVPGFSSGDECFEAIPAVLGFNGLDTICATTSTEPYDDAQCGTTFLGGMTNDVWYTYTADNSGLLNVRTCEIVSFDTDVVVYSGDCANLVQIACNGDGFNAATGQNCTGFTSAVEDIPITAGETYLIRIGGWDDASFGKGLVELEYRQQGTADPITNMTCDANCTDTSTVNWTNGGAYDSINVYINGAFETTLAGSASTYSANPINGIRDICLEPVIGSTVGAQTCCTAFGLTPPPVNVSCDRISGTTDVAVAWINPVTYNAVEVYVAGAFFASLSGTTENILVPGAGTNEICVRGLLANCWSDLECCTGGGGTASPITNMTCDANCTDTSTVNWTNGGAYDSINVYINGTFETTLAGSASTYSANPINGIRDICLEPVIGSTAGPQTCCTAFGLTPPPVNVVCDPLASTSDVFVAWDLPIAYDGIEIWVNGAFFTSLSGTATTFTVAAGVGQDICVRGLIANCWSDLVCCDNTGTPPGVGSINCDPNEPASQVVVVWTPPIVYDTVEISLNGLVVQTISGTASPFVTVTGVTGIREICVTGIIGGIATEPACCTVDLGSGPETFIRGDTNHDGIFNIADAIQALGELFSGVPSLGCPDANDANDDGNVDIGDAIGILTTLFSGGSIPAPHPGCGPDPTADALGPCTYTACP